MGKSDPHVFQRYRQFAPALAKDNLAFLGFQDENAFTRSISGGTKARDFYDIALDNWDINSDWQLKQKYDAIICTRCAYFAKNPATFLQKCKEHLEPGGLLLVDWGLGDHWRFQTYKVGWVRHGEHEHAYIDQNFLYSCYWHPRLAENEDVKTFWKFAKKVGMYEDSEILGDVIKLEVPSVLSDFQGLELLDESTLVLWPESPQLYIIQLLKSND